jgi:carbon storage regulator
MLVLARKLDERIIIGEEITIQVVDVDPATLKVKIGIDAPRDLRVDREEVKIAIEKARKESSTNDTRS